MKSLLLSPCDLSSLSIQDYLLEALLVLNGIAQFGLQELLCGWVCTLCTGRSTESSL